MWSRLIRDVLSPLVGLGLEIFEAVWAEQVNTLIVGAGLVMIGVPIDAAAKLLGQRLSSPPESSQPTPPKVPS